MFWRGFVSILVIGIVLAAVSASAAVLPISPGYLTAFIYPANIPAPLVATIDIEPDSLQKTSQGQSVTAFIELPPGNDVHNIDVDSVRLCYSSGCIARDGAPGARPQAGDYDNDGIPDLKVTFGRTDILRLFQEITQPTTVTLNVLGKVGLNDFIGNSDVKVVP